MIKDFTFEFPTRVEFGSGYIAKVGDIAKEYSVKKTILVTDKGIKQTPIFDRVYRSLEDAGIAIAVFDEVRPNPRDVDAQVAGEFAKKEHADGVIGLGGGSSIDIAKAVSVLLTNEGGIECVMKPNKPQYDAAPLICIPTTAGTGSEVTSFAVLTIEKEKRKSSIFDNKIRPKVAINDPEVLKGAPTNIAAATGMDALTHAIEAYTCTLATPMTDGMALQAIRYIARSLSNLVHNRDDQSCYDMMMGSLLAGIAFGFSDIAGVHCMAEALGGMYDTPHGVANSIFLPLVFEYNIPANIQKHKDVGIALGIDATGKSDREIAQAAVEWLKTLSKDINIPNLCELGYVNPDDFDFLSSLCMKNVSLPSNARKITKIEFKALFQKAFQI